VRAPSKKKAAAAKLRSWRVSILRQRDLGTVEAPDEAAETAAVAQFDLSEGQCKRLVVWESEWCDGSEVRREAPSSQAGFLQKAEAWTAAARG
jgi:hypothetical protein